MRLTLCTASITDNLTTTMKAVFILLLTLGTAQAQHDRIVSGKISDAMTGMGLEGATVVLLERAGKGIHTDVEGRFTLTLPADKLTLLVSHLGYATQQVLLPISWDEVIHVRLKPVDNQLNEVVVVDPLSASCPNSIRRAKPTA